MKKEESFLCQCKDNNGLFVPNRQLSGVVAGLLFLLFCTFMTGYFLGKKYGIEQFTQKMYTNFLDDNSNQALSTITNNGEISAQDAACVHVSSIDSDYASNSAIIKNENEVIEHGTATINSDIDKQTSIVFISDQKYYAQLIGFGTEKAAELFVQRVASKGITTEIRKRTSKTAKGRTSYWYQVVTPAYPNKDDLSIVVNQLVKTEKLKDVCIRTC